MQIFNSQRPSLQNSANRYVLADITNLSQRCPTIVREKCPSTSRGGSQEKYIINQRSRCLSQRAGTVRFQDIKVIQTDLNRQMIIKIDELYKLKSQCAYIYAHDISEYLRSIENEYVPKMMSQQSINQKMRSILIDWLIDVSFKFRLRQETLYLAINILDRFLGLAQVSRNTFQLIGVACLCIVSKIEEIYPPSLKDLCFITENSINKQQIIEAEAQILLVLEFKLTGPTVYSFIQRMQTLQPIVLKHFYLVQYLLELYLIDQCQTSAVLLAAAAFYSVRKIKRYTPAWTQELVIAFNLEEPAIRNLAKYLFQSFLTCQSTKQNQNSVYQAVQSKFSQPKYLKLAL